MCSLVIIYKLTSTHSKRRVQQKQWRAGDRSLRPGQFYSGAAKFDLCMFFLVAWHRRSQRRFPKRFAAKKLAPKIFVKFGRRCFSSPEGMVRYTKQREPDIWRGILFLDAELFWEAIKLIRSHLGRQFYEQKLSRSPYWSIGLGELLDDSSDLRLAFHPTRCYRVFQVYFQASWVRCVGPCEIILVKGAFKKS